MDQEKYLQLAPILKEIFTWREHLLNWDLLRALKALGLGREWVTPHWDSLFAGVSGPVYSISPDFSGSSNLYVGGTFINANSTGSPPLIL